MAAAAALFTGVAATGTFSTDGLNATPNVVADQWTAAERAGVLIAETDLATAQRVAHGDPDEAQAEFDRLVGEVGDQIDALGSDGEGAADAWSTYVVEAERAGTTTGFDSGAGQELYGTATASAQDAMARVAQVAEQRSDDLSSARSDLTTVLGTLATLILLGILVFLALRTRRIINVPLLVATVITGGLTYLSANPASLPLDYDAQLAGSAGTATALQDVHQARAAQYAESVGAADGWADGAGVATAALSELEAGGDLVDDWETIAASSADSAGIEDTQAAYDDLTATLSQRLDEELSSVDSQVGAPALITAGAALLLGAVAAALAWTGITRRLQDYR